MARKGVTMKNFPKNLQTIIEADDDLQDLIINSIRGRKTGKTQKSTVSLPKSVITKANKICDEYGFSKKEMIHIMVQSFVGIERFLQKNPENKESMSERFQISLADYFPEGFENQELERQSYLMHERDVNNLSLIANTSKISRNVLISIGICMLSDKYSQFDEAYLEHVKKFRAKYKKLLKSIQDMKEAAVGEWGVSNDEIVLLAERLAMHTMLQIIHMEKFIKDGFWSLGTTESESIDHLELLKDLFSEDE
jgi:hypothetical protein